MEKTPAYCTHSGKCFQFWKQYTLKFCPKLCRKTFATTLFPMNGKDTNWLSPWLKTCCIHPSWRRLPVWKQFTLKFCHKHSRKTFFFKMACWIQLTAPIVLKVSSSESSTLSSFVTNLAGKPFWRHCSQCMEKTPSGSRRAEKTCYYVTTYRVITYYFNLGTYAPTLMANQPELQFIAGVKPWTTIIFLREEIGGN